MATLQVEFYGIPQLEYHLDQYTDPAALSKRMKKACYTVEKTAKSFAPVDTGALRRSIASRVYTEGGNVVGEIYSDLDYAIYVEYGTGIHAESGGGRETPWVYMDDKGEFHTTQGMYPQPFMRPALTQERAAVERILGNA